MTTITLHDIKGKHFELRSKDLVIRFPYTSTVERTTQLAAARDYVRKAGGHYKLKELL